ncbi:ribosomal protein S12 methylthiotransferase RimO [Helicobacter enhydrae]|uniref:Ribosomal protein uS12 methylthiotransferase RimO n=1 Tax=Helicobacter enhydrae TaxID=222136 RepID=A0A1B1U5V7_9HELI|nr:30S ribosomal protein S12 methylthiotransferase RimO [Helicobacter enhydrae]ANV98111.1 ribosomal protein S12 methylthiotransferase RimO [Helicobacter enhydrae]
MSKKLHLISLGCTKNLVDSEVMLGRLKDYALTDEVSEADVILVNTCGFVSAAKEESIRVILEASSRRKEGALLVASGCLSERYRHQLLEEMPEIDLITGVGDYDKIDELIAQKENAVFSPKVFLSDNHQRVITGSNIHAYVKLSEGCNQTCSFCSIPSFKGKLHSRSIQSVLKEVEQLSLQGYQDVSFLAQDSSSYLRDCGEKNGLIGLIQALEEQNRVKSARILYLYPTTTTLELIEQIANSKIVQNYFDMPIQHISSSMLKRMKRGASKDRHIELLKAMRETKDSFLRTTLIIGHPQESDEEFEELCEFIEGFRFDAVNLFAFSSEEGTLAHQMDGHIPSKIINARIATINKIIQKQQQEHRKHNVGKVLPVIIEGKSEVSEYFYSARAVQWAPQIDGEILINQIAIDGVTQLPTGYYQARITETKGEYVFAEVVGVGI